MAIEKDTAPPARVDGVTGSARGDGWDGIRKVRINRHLDIGGAVDQSDERVVGGCEVRHGLGFSFAPKIFQTHRIIRSVEPPHPVTNGGGIGIGGSGL